MRNLVIGETFSHWTVIGDASSTNERYWTVQCSCGDIHTRRVSQLTLGRTHSCRTCAAKLREFSHRYYDETGLSTHALTLIKTNAKHRNIPCDLEFIDLTNRWKLQKGKCAYTGLELKYKPHQRSKQENTASLDRIDSNKGYHNWNIQWVHKTINFMKLNLSHDEFLDWCTLVADYNK